jgi:hypothetical protein
MRDESGPVARRAEARVLIVIQVVRARGLVELSVMRLVAMLGAKQD